MDGYLLCIFSFFDHSERVKRGKRVERGHRVERGKRVRKGKEGRIL